MVDARGTPLALTVTGANAHDVTALTATVDALAPVPGLPGRPRRRPDALHADKAYDARHAREVLRQRGITPHIPRRGTITAGPLGRHRWVVERTHAWFNGFGKLRIRFERSLVTHLGLLNLAAAVICLRAVMRYC